MWGVHQKCVLGGASWLTVWWWCGHSLCGVGLCSVEQMCVGGDFFVWSVICGEGCFACLVLFIVCGSSMGSYRLWNCECDWCHVCSSVQWVVRFQVCIVCFGLKLVLVCVVCIWHLCMC